MAPDVVYILKDTVLNPELMYSIRSVENNFPGHRIVFSGGSPANLKPDVQVTCKQNLGKWNSARRNILEACKDDRLSPDIYIFNDDFFVMRKVDAIPVFTNGDLDEFLRMVENNTGVTEFTTRVRDVYNLLLGNRLPTKNYEVHTPMLINRQKMLDLVETFPDAVGLRSLYGNCYRVPSIEVDNSGKMQDGVQQKKNGVLNGSRMLVSTTDTSFMGMAGKQIKRIFNQPSKYERG